MCNSRVAFYSSTNVRISRCVRVLKRAVVTSNLARENAQSIHSRYNHILGVSFANFFHCLRAYMQSKQEPSGIQTERKILDYEHSCTHPQGNPDQVILPAIPKEVVRQMFEIQFLLALIPCVAPIKVCGRSRGRTHIIDKYQ